MLSLMITLAAHAAPPSSALSGPNGTLTWTVASTPLGVHVEGRSPKWTVSSDTAADLTPIHTVRSDAAGNEVAIDYAPDHVVVHLPKGDVTHRGAGIWDGDTVDVRLGDEVAHGRTDVSFDAVDGATGDVWSFNAHKVGVETIAGRACTHEQVQLGGLYRYAGPTFDYWYAADGSLVRFTGPIGTFEVVP